MGACPSSGAARPPLMFVRSHRSRSDQFSSSATHFHMHSHAASFVASTQAMLPMRGVRVFIFPHWFIGQCEKIKVERVCSVVSRYRVHKQVRRPTQKTCARARSNNAPNTLERIGCVSGATDPHARTLRIYAAAFEKLNARVSTTNRSESK